MRAVSHLPNTEVYNRWQQCYSGDREAAADYWYNFLLTRAKYGDKDAKRYTNFIKQVLNTR